MVILHLHFPLLSTISVLYLQFPLFSFFCLADNKVTIIGEKTCFHFISDQGNKTLGRHIIIHVSWRKIALRFFLFSTILNPKEHNSNNYPSFQGERHKSSKNNTKFKKPPRRVKAPETIRGNQENSWVIQHKGKIEKLKTQTSMAWDRRSFRPACSL